jgi:uncharacterized protein (DUF2249 family)
MSPSKLVQKVLGLAKPPCDCGATDREVDAAPGGAIVEAAEPAGGDGAATRTIDVGHLPPPLPMVRILEALRELGPGATLLVRHTRRPIHLYPRLDALGCAHETTELGPKRFEILITKPDAA